MKTIFNIIIGFALIIAGIILTKDYILPFFKVFAGIILFMIGIGMLFRRSSGHVKYRVR